MRKFLGVVLALLAGAAAAGEVEHKRGEYRFSVAPEPAYVEAKPLPASWEGKAPGATGAAWRVWLFDEQIDRRAGRNQVYVDYAYETQSASLLGEAGRYQITFNPEYQQLVIHRIELRRNGQWLDRLNADRISLARREEDFEEDMADGNVTALVVLDDVRVNDVVRLRYSIIGSNPILAGQIVDGTNFGWYNPMLASRLRVLHDAGAELDIRRAPGAPEAHIRNSPEAVEVMLEASRIRAYTDEGSYPIWYQRFPAVNVSKKRQWSDVVDWAIPLYPKPGKLPEDLEKELAAWAALPTPEARVKAALRMVQEQVRYFGAELGASSHRPSPPADTWSRRYGDCKDKVYLLKTLLERMGIDAAPALVATNRGRGVAGLPPAASVFDHVIVRVKLDGATLWLDPTITSQGGDPRDSDASVYGVALPIVPGTKGLETIIAPAKVKASVEVKERYEAQRDGKQVKLVVETTYLGRSADDMRRSLSGARKEEIERRYAEYYRKRFGDVDVVDSSVKDDREANRLSVAEQYVLKSPFESDGRVRALDVYAESIDAPTRMPDAIARTSPLYVGMPAHYRHEIQVRMPERWTSSLVDESHDYRSEAFAYQRSLTVKDRQIDLVHDLNITSRDIAADKVAPHLGELRRTRDDLSARLSLRLPDGDQRQERDARLKALLKDIGEGK